MKLFSGFLRFEKCFLALVVLTLFGILIWSIELNVSDFVSKSLNNYDESYYFRKKIIKDYLKNFSIVAKFPTELDIENVYWQRLNTSKVIGTMWMVNAYYDNRTFLKDKPVVRILTYIQRFNPLTRITCQLWFEELSNEPVVVKAEYNLVWFGKSGDMNYGTMPYLVNCMNPLASNGLIPTSISLTVEKENRNARNKLKVIKNFPIDGKKKFVGICSKDLEYPKKDISLKLIEWVEIVHLLGADMVYMYVVKVHPNTWKTLKYFEAQGKLKVELVTVPKGFPGKHGTRLEAFKQEMISLNDCFNKHIHEYEYMLPIDTDEFIIPNMKEDRTWRDMINRVRINATHKDPCCYFARNVFFLEDNKHENETQTEVPSNMYFLQHVYRAQTFSNYGTAVKSFQNTENVIIVHNHYPLVCRLAGRNENINPDIGKLHHYKRGCGACSAAMRKDYTENTVKDLTLWKYKDELIANVNKTLEGLKSFTFE